MNYRHIYDAPEIYDALYNRSLGHKVNEAICFADVTMQMGKAPKTVLELFSGSKSSHREAYLNRFKEIAGYEPHYLGADWFASEGNIKIDDITGPWGNTTYDVVQAFYYSASSIVSESGYITRDYTQQVINNAYKHLNEGGLFLLDACISGFDVANSRSDKGVVEMSHPVAFGNLLWRQLNAKYPPDNWVLEYSCDTYYDRLTANNVEVYTDMRVLDSAGNVLERWEFELPFCQRYFSEPEIIDMMMDAGFEITLWDCNYQQAVTREVQPETTKPNHPNVYVGVHP